MRPERMTWPLQSGCGGTDRDGKSRCTFGMPDICSLLAVLGISGSVSVNDESGKNRVKDLAKFSGKVLLSIWSAPGHAFFYYEFPRIPFFLISTSFL